MRTGGRLVTAGVAVALVASVAACDSDKSSSSAPSAPSAGASSASPSASSAAPAETPARAVQLAADTLSRTGTAHVVAHVVTRAVGQAARHVPGPITMDMTADLQWSPTPKMTMSMNSSGRGQRIGPLQGRLIGLVMYLQMPQLRQQFGKPWAKLDLRRLPGAGRALSQSLLAQTRQVDPGYGVRMLRGNGDLRRVGSATVDGVQTTHYAGRIPLRRFIRIYLHRARTADPTGRLDGPVGRSARRALQAIGLRRTQVDVWLDGRHQLRRETLRMEGKRALVTVGMLLSKYGEKVTVVPPPASQTVDLSELLRGRGPGNGING